MTKILLHACCAPCATYVQEWLKQNDFAATGFFYNPNIYPWAEYEKRKKYMEYYSGIVDLPMTYIDNFLVPEAGRCDLCYENRLRRTAQYGKSKGFDSFSSTLLISPYQKHDLLKEIGEKVAGEEGIDFFYHDFREGYFKSRELAKRYNLYRQKYCGCSTSQKAREALYEQTA